MSFQYPLMICLIVAINGAMSLKNKADCDIEKPIRNCLKLGFLFDADGARFEEFPTTMDGMNKACEEIKKAEECAKNFISRCADSSFEERILGHLLEGQQRVMKRICRTNTRKNELLRHVPCANAVVDDTYDCVGDYKKLVYAANKLQDKDKILRILCCKIREVVPCVAKAMKAKGEQTCPKESKDYFRDMQKRVREEMTSVICADFERDRCENVQIPQVTDSEYQGKALYDPMRSLFKKVVKE